MQKQFKDLYEKYWIDVGALLLVALLFGGGLLMIKKSSVSKSSIEIIESKGVEEAGTDSGVKGISDETEKESDLININTASQKELEKLPGVGTVTAEKIIDYREENGAFYAIEDIMEVKGIGEGKFEDMEDLITAE